LLAANKIALSEIDVTRDVMDFTFVLRSDIDTSNFTYTIDIEDWTMDGMQVKVNFSDPLMISRGKESDILQIHIINRHLFKSNITGDSIDESNTKVPMAYQFPKQLPEGVSQEDIELQATMAGGAMVAMFVLQLLGQIYLKKNKNDLLSLYFSL
jgi:hypothetical protein